MYNIAHYLLKTALHNLWQSAFCRVHDVRCSARRMWPKGGMGEWAVETNAMTKCVCVFGGSGGELIIVILSIRRVLHFGGRPRRPEFGWIMHFFWSYFLLRVHYHIISDERFRGMNADCAKARNSMKWFKLCYILWHYTNQFGIWSGWIGDAGLRGIRVTAFNTARQFDQSLAFIMFVGLCKNVLSTHSVALSRSCVLNNVNYVKKESTL